MLAFARRLTGLVVAFGLVVGLPVAAARASCVCDHGHGHAHGASAPTAQSAAANQTAMAEECPMHRHDGPSAHATRSDAARSSDSMRCACAGQAQALFGRAIVTGVVPAVIHVDAPAFARPARISAAEALLSLAATPPAPPPRA